MEAQQVYQQEIKKKLKDRYWRLNNLYWITNEKGEKIKFKLNFAQQYFYNNMWYFDVILKSRQHGITTFVCIFFLDTCLFNSNVKTGIIAHNVETSEAFFRDKTKFAYDNLPEWLRKEIPANTSSAKELSFPNNSSIRIGTSMRMSTLQYLHISEMGKICRKYPERADEIISGSINTVHPGQFVFIESTAEGAEGHFYDIVKKAQKKHEMETPLTSLDFKYFFFPWFHDTKNQIDATGIGLPLKLIEYFEKVEKEEKITLTEDQKAWYFKKWETQGDLMYREYPSTWKEAFKASLMGNYYASEFQRIYHEKRICRVPYDPHYRVYTWWDLGMDDSTTIWFTQNRGREIRVIDYFEHSDEGLSYYVNVLQDKNYRYGGHTAPHDINVRELGTGKSRLETAASMGLDFDIAPKLPVNDGIQAVRSILPYCVFDEENCTVFDDKDREKGIASLENYRKEWDETLGIYRDKPRHDGYSHGADGFRTMAVSHTFETNLWEKPPVKDAWADSFEDSENISWMAA